MNETTPPPDPNSFKTYAPPPPVEVDADAPKPPKARKSLKTPVIIALIMLPMLIGIAAYFLLGNSSNDPQISKSQASTTTKAAAAVTKQEATAAQFTDGPGADWQTYTNTQAGFSVQIPKNIQSGFGAPCTQSTSPASYRPASGVVPATVIQDGNNFYVTDEYTYQLTQESDNSDGTSTFKGCQKTQSTSVLIAQYQAKPSPTLLLDVLPLTVASAQSQDDVLAQMRQILNDNTVVIDSVTKDKSGDWLNVTLKCPDASPMCGAAGFRYQIRYYEQQHKMVYIVFGQSGHLAAPTGDTFYDQQVADSIKIL